MKLRSFIAGAIALVLSAALAHAQVSPGTSPLSGSKGGTGNAFMQFTGPATSIKTYTLPNASDTLAALGTIQTWTGAQSFTDGKLILLGSSSGAGTLKAPAAASTYVWTLPAATGTLVDLALAQTLTNKTLTSPILTTPALGTPSALVLTNATGLPLSGHTSQAAYTFVGNNTGSSAAPTAVDIAALTTKGSPAAGDYVILSDQAASGAWKKATVSSVGSAGSVSSIAGNTGAFTLSNGITNSTNDIRLSLNSAVLSAQPSNPGGTSSGTAVMMGLGVTTCRFTPTYSSRVEFEIFGDVTNGAAGTVTVRIAFGTGAGPANGAAASGTTFGSVLAPSISGSSDVKVFKNGGIVTGLTPSTTYWFDIQLSTSTNTANLLALTCNAKEIL